MEIEENKIVSMPGDEVDFGMRMLLRLEANTE